MACASLSARAGETLRVATWNVELARKGPGALLGDILKGKDKQVAAVVAVIAEISPDILVLQGVDYDPDGHTLTALAGALEAAGASYPHRFSSPPNTGIPSGFDLDRNGRLGDARDALSYGTFRGEGGMVILSRWPLRLVADHTRALWRDSPGATLPEGYYTADELTILPLSSVNHWDVAAEAPGGAIRLLAFHAGTPVFDGPEDRNGLRNRDEVLFWARYLDGDIPGGPAERFVILGDANLDPEGGQGHRAAISALLAHPLVQDPGPVDTSGAGHTARWDKVGDLRVDYVLPSADLRVLGAGVFRPAPGDPLGKLLGKDGLAASRHALVWVDLAL